MFRSAEKSPGADSAKEMAKLESSKEYVLQWTGHAAHVTERFSGLLARQALVDVTLICQGQKLRVHKLVLASSSLYFEEMLEQDLGQEPIILLRDLDFDVLKAMVEFMYCGETTVSQCHLQTLLDAAQVFKVKELQHIVETMIESKPLADKVSPIGDASLATRFATGPKKTSCKARPSGERCEKLLPQDLEESEISVTKIDRTLDNNTRMNYTDEENSLYEIVERADEQSSSRTEIEELDRVSLDLLEGESLKMSVDPTCTEESTDKCNLSSLNEDNPMNSLCTETRCEFINSGELGEDSLYENTTNNQSVPEEASVGECSRVYTPKKRKLHESKEYTREESFAEEDTGCPTYAQEAKISNPSKPVGKGNNLKVYTHKRRKSIDDKRSQAYENTCDLREEARLGTSSIDLNDESSSSEAPIDISTASLDMETSEYIWSLSTETIQNVVGCTINSNFSNPIPESSVDAKPENSENILAPDLEISSETKEPFSCGHVDISETPVLRRSVRINQLENDDSLNNNNNNTSVTNVSKSRDKSLENDDYTKKRRNNFRVTDENVEALEKTQTNSRSLRSAAKLSKTKITRTRDDKTKNNRQSREKTEKNSDSTDILVNTRLNTIASVDRALWGDMSDFLENHRDSSEALMNHETSREIPFAVGLLPLRAALERMQATVDHQPRKTRSSVAPWRQETNAGRRKFYELDNRKHPDTENVETAVCHIEIRTSPNRNGHHDPRISTDERIIAVGTKVQSNDQ